MKKAIQSLVVVGILLVLAGCSQQTYTTSEAATPSTGDASICTTDSENVQVLEQYYLENGYKFYSNEGKAKLPSIIAFASFKNMLREHNIDHSYEPSLASWAQDALQVSILYGECLSTDANAWLIDLGAWLSSVAN